MRAALQIAQSGKSCALLSKVFPTRSHTVSAQGGITVALGNAHDDNWQWHMYDNVSMTEHMVRYIDIFGTVEHSALRGRHPFHATYGPSQLRVSNTPIPS